MVADTVRNCTGVFTLHTGIDVDDYKYVLSLVSRQDSSTYRVQVSICSLRGLVFVVNYKHEGQLSSIKG